MVLLDLKNLKIILVGMAIVIAIGSLLASNILIKDLQKEELNNVDVWAEAMRTLQEADETADLNLVLKVIEGNNTIPVIVLDKNGNVQTSRNIDIPMTDDPTYINKVSQLAQDMKRSGQFIRIELQQADDFLDVCYDDSLMLKRLASYPYIQLAVVIIFVLIALFALFSSMKAEQNKVWVGLSKETAHQLGTPISSLTAWTQVLKETYPQDEMLPEMEKDVNRLERIAERFSKIGSIPEPKETDVCQLAFRVIDYMQRRFSSKVVIHAHNMDKPVVVMLIPSLFEWVLENLCKNAVDAMEGKGRIDITLFRQERGVAIEMSDTGRGMPHSVYKDVFKPGFTTKKRGWGLGLSLAKRIVEEYHKGRIYVKSSEVGKGTTFRIELKG